MMTLLRPSSASSFFLVLLLTLGTSRSFSPCRYCSRRVSRRFPIRICIGQQDDLSSQAAASADKPTARNNMASKASKKALYSFVEARRLARGHGFSSAEEFLDYSCPGAYQLPKNPHVVWAEDWKGWEDWLGIPYGFMEGRQIARSLGLDSEQEYLEVFRKKEFPDDHPAIRVPFRPDLYYKQQWQGWDGWLGLSS